MELNQITILSLNCRGAGNQQFLRNLRDLIKVHDPKIMAILEPRISGQVADEVCRKINWENWYHVEATGFNGGVWVLWRRQ